jgi:hypothetical protein
MKTERQKKEAKAISQLVRKSIGNSYDGLRYRIKSYYKTSETRIVIRWLGHCDTEKLRQLENELYKVFDNVWFRHNNLIKE